MKTKSTTTCECQGTRPGCLCLAAPPAITFDASFHRAIREIAETLQRGARVWGGGVSAGSLTEWDGGCSGGFGVWYLADDHEFRVEECETSTDAAWALVRRCAFVDGATFTVEESPPAERDEPTGAPVRDGMDGYAERAD